MIDTSIFSSCGSMDVLRSSDSEDVPGRYAPGCWLLDRGSDVFFFSRAPALGCMNCAEFLADHNAMQSLGEADCSSPWSVGSPSHLTSRRFCRDVFDPVGLVDTIVSREVKRLGVKPHSWALSDSDCIYCICCV